MSFNHRKIAASLGVALALGGAGAGLAAASSQGQSTPPPAISAPAQAGVTAPDTVEPSAPDTASTKADPAEASAPAGSAAEKSGAADTDNIQQGDQSAPDNATTRPAPVRRRRDPTPTTSSRATSPPRRPGATVRWPPTDPDHSDRAPGVNVTLRGARRRSRPPRAPRSPRRTWIAPHRRLIPACSVDRG